MRKASVARVVVFDLHDALVVEQAGALAALGEVVSGLADRPLAPDDASRILAAIPAVCSNGRPSPSRSS